MKYFFEEIYDPREISFPGVLNHGGDESESFDSFKSSFKISELRSMSRSSVILRNLAVRGMSRIPFELIEKRSIGVYLLGEEGNFSSFSVESLFAKSDREDIDTLRKIPAKSLIGLPISMAAAQLEMSSGACGPIVCADLSLPAIQFILDEIEYDFESGRIKSFFIGALRDSGFEAAWLVFSNGWAQDLKLQFKEQLERIVHVAIK